MADALKARPPAARANALPLHIDYEDMPECLALQGGDEWHPLLGTTHPSQAMVLFPELMRCPRLLDGGASRGFSGPTL